MPESDWTDIADFVSRHAEALGWIIRDSQGLWAQEDLAGEIFVLLHELGEVRGRPLDLDANGDAADLLRHLRRIANRNGRTLRNASRLDLAQPGQTSLLERLVADDGEHPLSHMEAMEDPQPVLETPDPYHSEAAAWHWLAHRFDHRMSRVADYLLVSLSWCRTCRRRARRRTESQYPLPHGLEVGEGDSTALSPWRRFKLPSRPKQDERQLGLDYWNHPEQPALGQMWLL